MHADDRLAGLELRHGAVQVRDQFAELPRHGPADGVGNVHRRRAGIDGRLADLDEEIRLGAGSILRRKLDVGDEFAGALHAIDGEFDDLALCLAEFELAVQLGRGEEDMDASLFAGRRDGLAGRLNVPWHTAGEAGDDRSLDFPGDGVDGGEVALADHGKTALDHVHLQPGELPRDLEFFAQCHRGAGALLAVAEGRVKNDDPVFFHVFVLVRWFNKKPRCHWQRGLRNAWEQVQTTAARTLPRSASPSSSWRLKLAIAAQRTGGPWPSQPVFPEPFCDQYSSW